MKTIGLLITLLAIGPQADGQRTTVPDGTIISSVDVTGFDPGRLSPGLREDIRALTGTPLKQERLDELAARIEAERPRHVAATRTVLDGAGQARVIFIVGMRGEERAPEDNVNARYIVENAEIVGVPDSELTQALRDDLQSLAGKRLDSDEADRVQDRVKGELPKYDISRRILRGSEPGKIRLQFEARRKAPPPWLRFEPLRSNLVYHSDQGWGSFLDLGIGSGDVRVTPLAAIDDGDDLIEEYSGFGLRFETRRLGTKRLGASFEWSTFDQDWQGATLNALAANPFIPPLYETRSTITPQVKFALTPELAIAAGVSIAELKSLSPATGSRMANAAIGSIAFDKGWSQGSGADHHLEASFVVRGGSRALESDLVYTSYLGQGSYRFDVGRHRVLAAGMAGRISGDAPMFERFSLGDSATLRGWDKYDIAPEGGDRVLYSSIEYRFCGVGVFLDVGSVWDQHAESRVRFSTGLTFHAGPAFAAIGFPLNTDNLSAVFTMGLRIPGSRIQW